jgi:hypothetical protein
MHYVFLALTFLGTLIHQCARDIIFAHTAAIFIAPRRSASALDKYICSAAHRARICGTKLSVVLQKREVEDFLELHCIIKALFCCLLLSALI